MVKVSTSLAPSSLKPPVRLAMEEGLAGSVRSIIWTPSSSMAVTAA